MPVLQFFYALYLRLSALGLLAVAAASYVLPQIAAQQGLSIYRPVDQTNLIIAAVFGVYFLIPWWLPGSLRRPSRLAHLVWAPILAGLSWLASSILISVLKTLEPLLLVGQPPLGPEIDNAWWAGAALGVFFVLILAALRAGAASADEEEVPDLAPTSPAPERFAALSLHRLLLAFNGVAMIASGVGIYLTMQRDPAVIAFYAEHGFETYALVSAALSVAFGVSFLFNRTMPRFVHRPSRWFHFPGIGLYIVAVALLSVGVLYWVAFPAMTAGLDPELLAQDPSAALAGQLDLVQSGSVALILSVVSFLGLIVTTLLVINRPVELDLPAAAGYAAHHTPAASGKRKKARRGPAPKLPAIGAAMKLYMVADWVVLRLLGLALMGTAYMLWGLIERDRTFLIQELSQGFAPFTALYIYGGVGVLLTMPFLLPGFIAAPRTVLGGLAKAVVLVLATVALYVPLQVAIQVYTPDIYHATLEATAPRAFKAVAGIAVTSALLISFFKQLGGVQKTDYQGRPIRVYSDRQLAAMRRARMGQDAPGH